MNNYGDIAQLVGLHFSTARSINVGNYSFAVRMISAMHVKRSMVWCTIGQMYPFQITPPCIAVVWCPLDL